MVRNSAAEEEARSAAVSTPSTDSPAGESDRFQPSYTSGQFRHMFDLTGRVALVAGGGGGLGGVIAMALADFGARVAIADLDLDAAKKAAQLCARPDQDGALAISMDVTKPGIVKASIAAIEEVTGKIDILVNCVGINIRKPALAYEPAEWRKILDVNLSGIFYVTQAVGRGMVERGYGRVLNIGSVSSLLGHPNHAPYAASKGGVALLTKVLATEWARHGVTVNALGPAYTETALTADLLADPAERTRLIAGIPAGRLGQPEDLTGAAVFLCSESSRFVTGQTLYIDGGRTAD
ncbi:MAG: glucose 1-dehydrogenase [Chloroflexia bacterium]|nr:glucose 1-dehydrogenase [Chloroflexia bacterium]